MYRCTGMWASTRVGERKNQDVGMWGIELGMHFELKKRANRNRFVAPFSVGNMVNLFHRRVGEYLVE